MRDRNQPGAGPNPQACRRQAANGRTARFNRLRLAKLEAAERRDADRARERRRRIRRQKQRIADARRAELAREAEAFWEKLTPRTRERLRSADVPPQAVVLLGLVAFDSLAADRFPSQNLRTMLREAAGETEDPGERDGLRTLLGTDPHGGGPG